MITEIIGTIETIEIPEIIEIIEITVTIGIIGTTEIVTIIVVAIITDHLRDMVTDTIIIVEVFKIIDFRIVIAGTITITTIVDVFQEIVKMADKDLTMNQLKLKIL